MAARPFSPGARGSAVCSDTRTDGTDRGLQGSAHAGHEACDVSASE